VIPNAIRTYPAVDQKAPGQVQVVFLGQLCDRKGTSILIDAWARIIGNQDIPPTKLIIVGWGEIDRARAQMSALGIEEFVDIRGWMSKPEVDHLLARTHVVVLPSLNEGQPMAILEAMARGICVVSTTAGGIPEMVGESEGVLVSPGDVHELADALAEVVNDREARRRFGAQARQRVEREFDLEVVSRRFDDLYRAALADDLQSSRHVGGA
jgi:glycosyltransferase involved in cell wall biosynthesis